jgi:hypothetical protein
MKWKKKGKERRGNEKKENGKLWNWNEMKKMEERK